MKLTKYLFLLTFIVKFDCSLFEDKTACGYYNTLIEERNRIDYSHKNIIIDIEEYIEEGSENERVK